MSIVSRANNGTSTSTMFTCAHTHHVTPVLIVGVLQLQVARVLVQPHFLAEVDCKLSHV